MEPNENSRIKMESYNGILFCDAVMNDEFTSEDVKSIVHEIKTNYNGHSDIILKKSGSYAVSIDAQIMLMSKVDAFRNFVYVAETSIKKESAKYAAVSYMAKYNTKVATSKEEAYAILKTAR